MLGVALAAARLAWRPAVGSAAFDITAAVFLVGVGLIVAGFTTGGR